MLSTQKNNNHKEKNPSFQKTSIPKTGITTPIRLSSDSPPLVSASRRSPGFASFKIKCQTHTQTQIQTQSRSKFIIVPLARPDPAKRSEGGDPRPPKNHTPPPTKPLQTEPSTNKKCYPSKQMHNSECKTQKSKILYYFCSPIIKP